MRFLTFIWKDSISRRGEFLIIILGVAFAVCAVYVLFSLRLGIEKTLFNTAESKNPLSQITVYPKSNGSFFSLLPGSNRRSSLTRSDVEAVSKLPNVKNIYPQAVYQGFSSVEFDLVGQTFQSDALIFGVPMEIVAADIGGSEWKDDSVVPVVISSQLLDLYNLSLAPGAGMPEISGNFLIGKTLKVLPGAASFLRPNSDSQKIVNGKIVGFSNRVDLIGITMPISTVEKLNLNSGAVESLYNKFFVALNSPQDVSSVTAELESKGYRVSSLQKEFNEVGQSMNYVSIILLILTSIILGIAALLTGSTVWSSLISRRKEFGMLRAIGAPKSAVINIILWQSAFYGIAGFVPGIILGMLVTLSFKSYLAGSWEYYSVSADAIFSSNLYLIGFLLAVSILITILSSVIPTIKMLQNTPRNLIST